MATLQKFHLKILHLIKSTFAPIILINIFDIEIIENSLLKDDANKKNFYQNPWKTLDSAGLVFFELQLLQGVSSLMVSLNRGSGSMEMSFYNNVHDEFLAILIIKGRGYTSAVILS